MRYLVIDSETLNRGPVREVVLADFNDGRRDAKSRSAES